MSSLNHACTRWSYQLIRCMYTLLTTLALPLLLLRLMIKGRHYRHQWWYRLGWVPKSAQATIWIHAVSVGEVNAIRPLVEQLENMAYQIVISTTTATGAAQVKRCYSQKIIAIYTPFDCSWIIQRVIRRLSVRACLIVEREIWPNLLHSCRRHRIPALLINARLSDQALAQYKRTQPWSSYLLAHFSCIIAQCDTVRNKFLTLGLPSALCVVGGNLKFDQPKTVATPVTMTIATGHRPILVAGSTHAPEEELLLDALSNHIDPKHNLLLVLAPRHPERFNTVADLLKGRKIGHTRRTSHVPTTIDHQVVLLDTLGELQSAYCQATMAFVGGTLCPVGGHSLIEPALQQLPIITGPHIHHIEELHRLLQQAQSIKTVSDAKGLGQAINYWLTQPEQSKRSGIRAYELVIAQQGACKRHLSYIKHYL